MRKKLELVLYTLCTSLVMISCAENQKTLEQMKEYDGPTSVMFNVTTLYSDSGIVKVKLSAPKQVEEQNGDRRFPLGLKVEFFERNGSISSVLTANSGILVKATDIFTATGNVIVKDVVKNKRMNTEILHWNRSQKKIYTDQFLTIEQCGQVSTGTGLTAAQDFSTYRILGPSGDVPVDCDEEFDDEEYEEEEEVLSDSVSDTIN